MIPVAGFSAPWAAAGAAVPASPASEAVAGAGGIAAGGVAAGGEERVSSP